MNPVMKLWSSKPLDLNKPPIIMTSRQYRPSDQLCIRLNKLLGHNHTSSRANPAKELAENQLTTEEKKHSQGLIRVDHCGEVCAQALYLGQALTAKSPEIKNHLLQAADEERDHLIWCRERLDELNSRSSHLNPIWYVLSYALGAAMGLCGDKISLGFIAATEELVGEHLQSHLDSLSPNDKKSIAVLTQMLADEIQHAEEALEQGGQAFSEETKAIMRKLAKLMTATSYHL